MLIRFFAVASLISSAAASAPPPPPPPGAMERANAIATLPTKASLEAYLVLFASDVQAFMNGKRVADGREQWRTWLSGRLGLHNRAVRISYGDPIMVTETLSNITYQGGGVVQDCCFWARVAIYDLDADGRAKVVRMFENETYWGPPEHPE